MNSSDDPWYLPNCLMLSSIRPNALSILYPGIENEANKQLKKLAPQKENFIWTKHARNDSETHP